MSHIKYGTTIPVFVKRLREEMQCSQRQFGDLLGVHGQYISNIERGMHKCPASFVAKLMTICPSPRRKYLEDLLADAASTVITAKVREKRKLHP